MRASICNSCHLLGAIVVLWFAPTIVCAQSDNEFKSLSRTALKLMKENRFGDAKPYAEKAALIAETSMQDQPEECARAYFRYAQINENLSRLDLAERYYRRAVEDFEKAKGSNVPNEVTAQMLFYLGTIQGKLARLSDSTSNLQRSLAMRKKLFGEAHPEVADTLKALGVTAKERGDFVTAEASYREAFAVYEKLGGPKNSGPADCLTNLAIIEKDRGDFESSEKHFHQAIEMYSKLLGLNHERVGNGLNSLGNLYCDVGRYFEADCLYRLATTIYEQNPSTLASLAMVLHNRGVLHRHENRLDEAEMAFKQALVIREQVLGAEHPFVASSLCDLGLVYELQKRYAEAEKIYRLALARFQKVYGDESHEAATPLSWLGQVSQKQKQYVASEEFMKRALKIYEKLGTRCQLEASATHKELADLYYGTRKYSDASEQIRLWLKIDNRFSTAPAGRAFGYLLKSQIDWALGRRSEALTEIRRALDLVDESRSQSSGADQERAKSFSNFSDIYDQMLEWQLELGDMDETLKTIDRSRARTLLDEMNRGRVDLNSGRSPEERQQLRQREIEYQTQLSSFERQREIVLQENPPNVANEERLRLEIAKVRQKIYDFYREERSMNPIYRQITTEFGSPTISQVREKLLGSDGLALVYQIGEEAGYLLIISPHDARLISLNVGHREAEVLGTTAGPLTVDRLNEILIGKKNSGVVPSLALSSASAELTKRLAALWLVLVPEKERTSLTTQELKRLVVIPDGPLALLPFEALVVQGADDPDYLLDVGPPIMYGPSMSVLYKLVDRPIMPTGKRMPVLTVADPSYPTSRETLVAARNPSLMAELSTRTRFAGIYGQLARLPFTGAESNALAKAYITAGLEAGQLKQDQATESAVRFNVSGRKVIHLACHGVTDQSYGNFFGALALTPGPQATTDPKDDGLLTMPEIYELDLTGCELAILSACETNYGPQQKGEGTWALSRAFLAAGARRVVASNWVVDDLAGASLISYFAGLAAQAEQEEGTVNHAEKLQSAKRYIRKNEKWKSPFYWSSFVFVGPQ